MSVCRQRSRRYIPRYVLPGKANLEYIGIHHLEPGRDPDACDGAHAHLPRGGADPAQGHGLAQVDVGDIVRDAGRDVAPGQGVEGAGLDARLVRGDDGSRKVAEGLEAIGRGLISLDDAVLGLESRARGSQRCVLLGLRGESTGPLGDSCHRCDHVRREGGRHKRTAASKVWVWATFSLKDRGSRLS
jgi:hypothetical protein